MNQSSIKSRLLASTLGLALLAGPVFAGQALAQQADAPLRRDMPMQNGAMPMPAPSNPAAGQGMAEPGRHRHGEGHVHRDGAAHRHGAHRAERQAQRAANREDAGELVQAASAALRAGRTAEATDLLERSETRLLTRAAPATRADQPASGPVLDRLAAARGAIRDRDRAGALREMDQALAGLRMAGGPSANDLATGSGTVDAMPAEGAGWGSGRMRDGGPAGTSMSRADHIVRVQAGGSGSGGLSGSTPGSPGVGNPGSTPSTGMGTATQPPQGSANPSARPGMGSPGVGAPQPGSGTPAPGGTGTVRPGSTPSGGGTGSNPSR